MKKIISKILIILIVFLLLFDFVFASQYRCVYAAQGPGKTIVLGITNLASGLVAIVYTLLKALVVGLTYGVQVLTTVTASVEGINSDNTGFWKPVFDAADTVIDPITPIDIFFNKYKLLDINYFDFEGLNESSYIYLFRISVAEWYAIMKLIACAILLVILLYVGIRMALSTIADDKAKYKKMLADWVVSLVLIFVLQYIIIFTVYCNNAIVNALKVAFADSEMSTAASNSIVSIGIQGIVNPGIISFASVLVYVFIVFQTIIFLLAYMKRMIKVGFLIIISPLISITYSIDKMGDGKAQALGNWLKEFVYTILIQPFHCIMYLALVETAINLLRSEVVVSAPFDIALFNSPEYNQLAAGVLAIMCLKFVNDGEQIVRKIFGFQDDGSTGMGAGAALGLAAIANAQKIGGATRQGINKINATGKKFGNAIKKDLGGPSKLAALGNKLANSKAGKFVGTKAQQAGNWASNTGAGKAAIQAGNFVGDKAQKAGSFVGTKAQQAGNFVGTKAQQAGKWVSNTGVVKAAKAAGRNLKNGASWVKGKAIKGANSNVGKYLRSKASLSTALGVMGAAMAYSSGSKSALDAIATGSAVHRGTQEFFGSSTGSVASDDADMHKASEAYAYDKDVGSKMTADKKGFSDEALQAIAAYQRIAENINKKDVLDKEIKSKEKEIAKYTGDEAGREKLEKELELLEEDREMLSDIIQEDEDLAKKYDENENLKGYSAGDFEDWKKAAEVKFDEERGDRFKQRRNAPDTQTLDKIKSDIIGQLRAAMKADKGGKNSNKLTVDEEATISSTAQLLMDRIALGTLNKKGFGQEEQKDLIIQNLGLQHEGRNHFQSGIMDFTRITDQYADCQRQAQIAANHQHVRSYDESKMDIASDRLLEREYGDYLRSIGRKPDRKITADED